MNFLEQLPTCTVPWEERSLSEITGETLDDSFGSYLVRTTCAAWNTPFRDVTCEHVRMLVSQKFGLEWIAPSVAAFVARYPDAYVTFYEGDFTINALKAFDKIKAANPEAANVLQSVDYSKTIEAVTWSREIAEELDDLLERLKR